MIKFLLICIKAPNPTTAIAAVLGVGAAAGAGYGGYEGYKAAKKSFTPKAAAGAAAKAVYKKVQEKLAKIKKHLKLFNY